MSRTDAHVPVHVRLLRRDLVPVEDHDHRDGPCDLPPLSAITAQWWADGRCHWEWHHRGERICSCELCSGGYWRRLDRRVARQRERVRLALGRRAWAAGDPDAFDG